MKNTTLFDVNNKYTPDAFILETIVRGSISQAFKSFIKLGYSPREISHIIQHVVFDTENESILTQDLPKEQ
jgi:hypothetical protein